MRFCLVLFVMFFTLNAQGHPVCYGKKLKQDCYHNKHQSSCEGDDGGYAKYHDALGKTRYHQCHWHSSCNEGNICNPPKSGNNEEIEELEDDNSRD